MFKLLLIIPFAIGAFMLWRLYATKRAARRRDEAIIGPLKPLIEAFENGAAPDRDLIDRLCENPAQRLFVWMLLDARERTDLFPKQYNTREKGAESNLCYWLLHPNELGELPDTLELWETVHLPAPGERTDAEYLIFKFGKNAPHWLAKSGLRAGVVGPYFPDIGHYISTPGTFSRFDPINEKSAEGHAQWVHEELLVKKGAFAGKP